MNKNKNPRRRASVARRPLPIILGLIVVIIVCFVIAKLLARAAAPDSSTAQDDAISENAVSVPQAEIQGESQLIPIVDNSTGEKHIPQYDGEDPNALESLTGSVTTSRISGQNYILRVNINQYLTSGTCHLEFTGSDATHTDDVAIIPSASSSTCEGFDIPLKALGSGTYIYNIYLTSGDRTGTITGEVTL